MVVASVEVPVTVKRPVVVAFTKFDEVAKRLDEVELVVEALTAAKRVAVALAAVRLVVEADTLAKRVVVAFVAKKLVVVAFVEVLLSETRPTKLPF